MSACSTSSSHSPTVMRKLPVMTPTPMITLTATINGDGDRRAAEGAHHVARSHAPDDAGPLVRMRCMAAMMPSVSSGVSRAPPKTMPNRPAKLTDR